MRRSCRFKWHTATQVATMFNHCSCCRHSSFTKSSLRRWRNVHILFRNSSVGPRSVHSLHGVDTITSAHFKIWPHQLRYAQHVRRSFSYDQPGSLNVSCQFLHTQHSQRTRTQCVICFLLTRDDGVPFSRGCAPDG